MKRHIVALAIGGLFAAPALANNEIDPGYTGQTTFVTDTAGLQFVNAEQGYVAKTADAGKSRAEVRAEIAQAARAGELVVNGELGSVQL